MGPPFAYAGAVSTGHTVALASRRFPHLPRALHTVVEAPGTVALLTGWYEPVRDRLAIDVAEEALRSALAAQRHPGLDALAAIVREVDAAVSDWVTESEPIDLWQWGGSIAIVHFHGPIAVVAQVGEITTLLNSTIAVHDDSFAHRLPFDASIGRETIPDVLLGSLGRERLGRVSLAQLELVRGDRIVLASRRVVRGVLAVDPATRAAHPAVHAEAIVQHAGDSEHDRACVVIAIDGPTDGPYR